MKGTFGQDKRQNLVHEIRTYVAVLRPNKSTLCPQLPYRKSVLCTCSFHYAKVFGGTMCAADITSGEQDVMPAVELDETVPKQKTLWEHTFVASVPTAIPMLCYIRLYYAHFHLRLVQVFIPRKPITIRRANAHQSTSFAVSWKAIEALGRKSWITNLSMNPHTSSIPTANITYCTIILEYIDESQVNTRIV